MKRIIIAIPLSLLLASISLSSPPVLSADCSKGGQVDMACDAESDSDYDTCCSVFNCQLDQQGNYCYWRARDTYRGCVLVRGCPGLAD